MNKQINFDDIYGVLYKGIIYMLTDYDDKYGLFINTNDLKNNNVTDNSYWKMSKRFLATNKNIEVLYEG